MRSMGMLIKGILVVAVFLAITAAIIAVAPYMAIIIVIGLVGWYLKSTEETPSE